MNAKKPRVRFCWECGNQLVGNTFQEKVIDGHPRILHKSCGNRVSRPTVGDFDKIRDERASRRFLEEEIEG